MDSLFGTGVDGDVTLSADTTLSRDMYYANLSLADGVMLHPNGYRIFVQDVLTLGNGAAIRRDGGTAIAGSASVMTTGTLAGGGDGQTDSPCHPSGGNVTNSLGGNAGSESGSVFGTATPPTDAVGGPQIFESVTSAITGRTLDGAAVRGGAGGDICGPGQWDGGGGGVIVIVARQIALGGATATISADGGNGTANIPGPPFAVGGGGGVIAVVTTTPKPSGLTLSVAGGTSVAPATSGAPGHTYWLD